MKVGVDLIEIERIRRALERHGDAFKERCFTDAERAYCDSKPNPPQHYAGRFAAKEAIGKALGSGVYFTWKEIEVRGRPKPGVQLSGRTAAWARKVGAAQIELSMTHSRELAAAVAVALADPRRLDGAGQGAQVPASPAPERDRPRRLDGAGQGAQVPASPALEREQ